MSGRIYFDHSATTPLDPRVRQAMAPFLDGVFGNPSSQHREGRQAREAIEKARAQVGALIGSSSSEIVFTASGTEADNLAILGVVRARGGRGHVITSSIEHPAVLETCRYLESLGTAVTYLPVDQYGLVNPEDVREALRPDTCLVSIMTASNLVGTIQPLAEIARITQEHGILFHTDAVQALGKIPLDVRKLPVDLISMSAHKLHGPKGIGALYIRSGVELSPVVFGGGQERGLRSATENVAGIVGFGAAAIIAQEELPIEALLLRALRERLLEGVRAALPQAYLFGHPETRLPGHLSLGFAGEESRVGKLLEELDNAGISVSAGSACSAHHAGNPSQALLAMGYSEECARGLLRVTLGRFNTREEVDRFLLLLPQAIAACNAESLLQAAS